MLPQSSAAAKVSRLEARKLALVRAAYEIIAHEGFENLRTRAVANKVGCNVATLHHYFPTKESMVSAVALYLAAQFETLRAPALALASPWDRLAREFADAAFYQSAQPEMVEVMRELSGRARRDPQIAAIVEPLKLHWRASLERLIADGMAAGEFEPGMTAAEAAGVLIALFWGAATLPLEPLELNCLKRAIELWLSDTPAAT